MKRVSLLLMLLPFIGFSQIQIGQDIDGEAMNDESGRRVYLSNNGSIVAIGARGNDGNGNLSGHVRVYENMNNTWIQKGEDIDGEMEGDQSGESISLSDDGLTIAIGAMGNNTDGTGTGHVRVFSYNNLNWEQKGEDIDGIVNGLQFGRSISLSSNGNILGVGITGSTYPGSVKLFEYINSSWTQIGNDIIGENPFDQSGFQISLSANGNIVAIGAPSNSGDDGNRNGSGHVRVYENINDTWLQIGQDIDGEDAGEQSGISLSLSSDGNIVAIGANRNDDGGFDSGQVRVYENINDTWLQIGQDIEGGVNQQLGYSVSISNDGNLLFIGTPYSYERVYRNLNGVWTQLGNNINSEGNGDFSGWSVNLSGNGTTAAVGAPSNSGNGNLSGHVRVYDLSTLLTVEESIQIGFNIYPNPTKNKFIIQLENPSYFQQVTIYNLLGQKVLISKEIIINTSNFASGTYLVEVITNKGKATKKLIIE